MHVIETAVIGNALRVGRRLEWPVAGTGKLFLSDGRGCAGYLRITGTGTANYNILLESDDSSLVYIDSKLVVSDPGTLCTLFTTHFISLRASEMVDPGFSTSCHQATSNSFPHRLGS